MTPMLCNAADILSQSPGLASQDQMAIVDGARRVTYAELVRLARQYAALLNHRGLGRGDRVVIFLPRSLEAVIALFATWFAGGVPVMADEHLRTRQVQHLIDHSEAALVITNTRQLLLVRRLPYDRVINLDHVDPPPQTFPPSPLIRADLALLIYTSGSTGLPKGVMLSHDNLLSGTQIVSSYLHLTNRDVILSVLPFSFDYGLNQLLTALFVGGTLVIQRSLFPPDICRTIEKTRVTGLAGVPTLWQQLIGRQSPFLENAHPTLRYITNSGGRLPEKTVELIRAAHPDTQIFLMYGLTEAFRSTYLPPDQVDCRPASIGKAIPNVELLVIDEDGRRCQPGEVGELVHRGANVAMGYWRDPAGTARVFRAHPLEQSRNGRSEHVVFSGDLVTMDADGYLYFVGRKDNLIKSRGVRVSPEEIESCIYSSGHVAHVVSFAVAGDRDENRIVVAVVPNDPLRFSEEAVDAFCRREMPEYMWPQDIWRMDDPPLTSSGKPDRCAIRQLYAEHCDRAAGTARTARTA